MKKKHTHKSRKKASHKNKNALRDNIIVTVYIILVLIAVMFIYTNLKVTGKAVTISDTCSAANTIFKISAESNAHIEPYDSTNYGLAVCTDTPSERKCFDQNAVISIYTDTNSHAAVPGTEGATDICYGKLDCRTVAEGDCDDDNDEFCVITISDTTNAHVATCDPTNAYDTKICCKEGEGCSSDDECDDGDDYTEDVCRDYECKNIFIGNCEEDSECEDYEDNTDDYCKDSICIHAIISCNSNSDCEDYNDCTRNICNTETNECDYSDPVTNGNSCNIDNWCYPNSGTCQEGICQIEQRDPPTGLKSCQTAVCDPILEEFNIDDDDQYCEDNFAEGSICRPDVSSDPSGCMSDDCIGRADGSACDNNIFCDGDSDYCYNDECIPTIGASPCEQDNVCKEATCNEEDGCVYEPDDSKCGLNAFCNVEEDMCYCKDKYYTTSYPTFIGPADEPLSCNKLRDKDMDTFPVAEIAPYVGLDPDCNDSQARSFPGNTETCDGIDNDCDFTIDNVIGETCDCYPAGKTEECGTDIGTCEKGTQTCLADNTWGDCIDDIEPVEEFCDGYDNDCDTVIDEVFDTDHDTYTSCGTRTTGTDGQSITTSNIDCDDTLILVNPNAIERCNGLDDDCDGSVDNANDWDKDGDGYVPRGISACRPENMPLDYIYDCDDTNNMISPGEEDICDGIDNDCDGTIDSTGCECAPVGLIESCGNNKGACKSATRECLAGNVWSQCSYEPSGIELCNGIDDDCNGLVDEDFDQDYDTYTTCGTRTTARSGQQPSSANRDCVDSGNVYKLTANLINPGATELCNGIDDNCDGSFDETWDSDGDGYVPRGIAVCSNIHELYRYDCNDSNYLAYPGAEELCDGIDNDCDGVIDTVECGCDGHAPETERCDGIDNDCDDLIDETWDHDGDGYIAEGISSCLYMPEDYEYDCDDSNNLIRPDKEEICDGIDNDCDGIIDHVGCQCTPGQTKDCGTDVGECEKGTITCNQDGTWGACLYSVNATNETCDGLDNDCDGIADELWDGDGDGVVADAANCTSLPADFEYDCDDTNKNMAPGLEEICDGIDNDCDGIIDHADCNCTKGQQEPCGSDIGECEKGTKTCTDLGVWSGCIGQTTGTIELCDGLDNDCDGHVDEDWDNDADNYVKEGIAECGTLPEDYEYDCDDNNFDANPYRIEKCGDNIDNDCNGEVDEGCECDPSADNETKECGTDEGECRKGIQRCRPDGVWGQCEGIIPASKEKCDGKDNNCNGEIDEGYDKDADHYTTCGTKTDAVEAHSPSQENKDCDDLSPATNPGASEICGNGRDENCNGKIDENCQDETEKDSDKDGMPDEWEKQYGLNMNQKDDGLDQDNDGFTNLQEYRANLNPTVSDRESCTDGERNQGEEGVDCGGPCIPCDLPSPYRFLWLWLLITFIIAGGLTAGLVYEAHKRGENETLLREKRHDEQLQEIKQAPAVAQSNKHHKLMEYINEQVKKGHSKRQIAQALLRSGWQRKDIVRSLARVHTLYVSSPMISRIIRDNIRKEPEKKPKKEHKAEEKKPEKDVPVLSTNLDDSITKLLKKGIAKDRIISKLSKKGFSKTEITRHIQMLELNNKFE